MSFYLPPFFLLYSYHRLVTRPKRPRERVYIMDDSAARVDMANRMSRASIPIAQIARRAGVPYYRLWSGARLTDEEVRRVLAVLTGDEEGGSHGAG
jgi:hypothetical protein